MRLDRGPLSLVSTIKDILEIKNSGSGLKLKKKTKLHGLSPRANYTHRATAACRRSDCQLLQIDGAIWSA
jgi:hypothetical protein